MSHLEVLLETYKTEWTSTIMAKTVIHMSNTIVHRGPQKKMSSIYEQNGEHIIPRLKINVVW